MSRVSQRDLRALLEFLQQSYAIQDLSSFKRHVLSGLQNLVPSEINAYNEVNLRTQHNEVFYDRPEVMSLPHGDQIFDRHIPEHPLIAYSKRSRGHGAVKISDFLSAKQFHRLGLYNEFFRRIGIEDQMVMSLPSPRPVVIGIALNRSRRSFSERDRLLLNLAQPHLLQACQNAEAWTRLNSEFRLMRNAPAAANTAVIVVSSTGKVQTTTAQARSLIAKYFPDRFAPPEGIPDLLERWIKRQRALLAGSPDPPPARRPLIIEHDGKCLVVRLSSNASQSFLLLDEVATTLQVSTLQTFGLTRREAEVLAWVAQGKTNIDVADILGASPRTVQKHLERIFQKLGVETRTAAAAKVLEDQKIAYINNGSLAGTRSLLLREAPSLE